MNMFYMTFGCGTALAGYALPLIANDEDQARAYMHEQFHGNWCGTYSQERWDEMKRDKTRYWPLEEELRPRDVTWFKEEEKETAQDEDD